MDLLLVIGGYNSSNTKKLKMVCDESGVEAFHIERASQLNPEMFEGREHVGITAGTSDVSVSREASRTLSYYGVPCLDIADVGVAGLWRLMERIEEIQRHRNVIVVAGFDAALPSVVGGLVPGLVIAVPTSTGYGVARGGETALFSSLVSCAPGVVVVNIDNGYGAACAAIRALRSRITGK